MEFQLKEIEMALNAGLYYIALQSTLALPDICGALQSSNGQASKRNYIEWYNTYVDESEQSLSAEDCYYFRCSVLHQGLTQHSNSSYSRIMFLSPSPKFSIHNVVLNDALMIDVIQFCKVIINSVRKWEKTVKDTEPFKTNYEKLIRIYPNGISPYVGGHPVIS